MKTLWAASWAVAPNADPQLSKNARDRKNIKELAIPGEGPIMGRQ
jgi:hypothetical protein